MPQFDFYTWISIGFYTILIFTVVHFLVLRFIIVPCANLHKTLIKVSNNNNNNKEQSKAGLESKIFHRIEKENLIAKTNTNLTIITLKKNIIFFKPFLKKKAKCLNKLQILILKKLKKKHTIKGENKVKVKGIVGVRKLTKKQKYDKSV